MHILQGFPRIMNASLNRASLYLQGDGGFDLPVDFPVVDDVPPPTVDDSLPVVHSPGLNFTSTFLLPPKKEPPSFYHSFIVGLFLKSRYKIG